MGLAVLPHKIPSRESTSDAPARIKSLLIPLPSGESNPVKIKLDLGFFLLFVFLFLVHLPHHGFVLPGGNRRLLWSGED